MSEVFFWIFLNNRISPVSAVLEHRLVNFFQGLRNNVDLTEELPAKLSYRACKFYRLKKPVSVDVDDTEGKEGDKQQDSAQDFPDWVKQACLEQSNRIPVNPERIKIRQLAEAISPDYIYLIIDFPDPLRESNEAVANLRREHDTLFNCLQVTVETMGKWRLEDIRLNLQGGILTDDDNRLPFEFREIQDALAKKRVYQADHELQRDFQNARAYQTQFNRIFAPAETESHTVTSDREFATFYNVLRCYDEDVKMITDKESSSAIKASNFTVHFIQAPFRPENDDPRDFKYYQEKSWGFPVFVDTRSARNVWRKFTPRSDWMVISPGYKIPFIISEVISNKQESDRSRMLVEAIALARAGKFLLQSTSKRSFFVVAIYVNANLIVSRYIVMQTGDGNTEHANTVYHNKAVCVHQKDFNLTENEEEVDFLREMYNMATQITALAGDLDQLKKESLKAIKDAAEKVLSLSSRHAKTKTARSTVMDSISEEHEGSEGSQDEADLGVFEAEDIQNVLREMNYKIEFIPWGHPQLAVIVHKTGSKHGYLKFVERENEVNVLRYLTEIKSASNHTISGVRFWAVEGGSMISMPVAGGWLTSLDRPSEHLWSVALQLIEAVGFMHEHNVAHMDIKPQNVVIPAEGGRLSVIDFSVSIRVRGPGVKYSGVVGTEDYMAPEVRKGLYKPMLADLWSCGKTLEELCFCCDSSADRTMLLTIARQLMDRDPEVRPKMATVLERMAAMQRREVNTVSPVLGFLPTVPAVRA